MVEAAWKWRFSNDDLFLAVAIMDRYYSSRAAAAEAAAAAAPKAAACQQARPPAAVPAVQQAAGAQAAACRAAGLGCGERGLLLLAAVSLWVAAK